MVGYFQSSVSPVNCKKKVIEMMCLLCLLSIGLKKIKIIWKRLSKGRHPKEDHCLTTTAGVVLILILAHGGDGWMVSYVGFLNQSTVHIVAIHFPYDDR